MVAGGEQAISNGVQYQDMMIVSNLGGAQAPPGPTLPPPLDTTGLWSMYRRSTSGVPNSI